MKDKSRPARGAWVEICCFYDCCYSLACRAPQGARGLKCFQGILIYAPHFVAPRKGRVG